MMQNSIGHINSSELNNNHQTLTMVANGEIDLALKQFKQIDDYDSIEFKNSFILYMLCLMELTLLDSKNKSFRKTAIEKILHHFNKQIPPHRAIKWGDFFSSYLMFLMAYEWAKLDINYLEVYKRTDVWDSDWLLEKEDYNDLQFTVLLESARSINNLQNKINVLNDISSKLFKQGKKKQAALVITEALSLAQTSKNIRSLSAISTEFGNQGNLTKASTVINEAISYVQHLNDKFTKSVAIQHITAELANQGKTNDTLTFTHRIPDEFVNNKINTNISLLLAKQGSTTEALEYANKINNEELKIKALINISSQLSKIGKLVDAESVLKETLKYTLNVKYKTIQIKALSKISTELAAQGKYSQSDATMLQAIRFSNEIGKNDALNGIAIELVKQGKINQALDITEEISHVYSKNCTILKISIQLAKMDKIKEAVLVMLEMLKVSDGYNNKLRF